MKKIILALVAVFCLTAVQQAQAQAYPQYYKLSHPNEISASYGVSLLGSMIGSVVSKADLIGRITGDDDYVAIKSGGTKGILNLGYTYQINKWFSVGATAGINRMSVNLEDKSGLLTAAAANIYTLMGTAAGLCALFMVASSYGANTTTGTGFEMDAIAMAVFGGISSTGGKGNMIGGFISAFIIVCLRIGLGQRNVNGQVILLIIGVLLIAAVALPNIFGSLRRARP